MSYLGFESATKVNDNLAGSHPPIEIPVVILAGSAYLRGHVLGKITTGGKYTGYTSVATDGSESAVAILVDDIDATAADKKAVVYVHGEFNSKGLIYTTPTDEAAGLADLFSVGIFCTDREA